MDSSISRFLLALAADGGRSFPVRRLFDAFHTPERILSASPEELDAIPGLDRTSKRSLLSVRRSPSVAGRVGVLCGQGIRILSYDCAEYPAPLRQIPDPPAVLFVRGRILPEDARALAVVGSRRAGAYGIAACECLVAGLVRNGFCIVSGMARGIDTVAHWSALENGGRTAGVLGTGADVIYPKSNAVLFERVAQQGFLVSELLPGTEARPENFPRRNRLISGLALGVLVVEAAERSGTMITVRLALEQGREVFAVPGDIRSALSRGTHRLIQQGAKLAGDVEDILEEFGRLPDGPGRVGVRRDAGEGRPEEEPSEVTLWGEGEAGPNGDVLLQQLGDAGTGFDTLVARTGWPAERLATLLTRLELAGSVRRMPGNRYARSL